jgi:predicted acetyltransferase
VADLSFTAVDVDSPLFAAFRRTQAAVFLDTYPDDEAVERRRKIAERTLRRSAVLDDDQVVATYVSWDTHVSVPGGGRVAADAVSGVTVLPTHRRRGILTRMIVADLADAAERGLPVAILIAAEAPIYGRYGFGLATETARWSVDVRTAWLAPSVPHSGTVEVVAETAMRETAPAVFEAARRPGALDQLDSWWDMRFGFAGDPSHKPTTWVVHRDTDGRADGYANYRPEESWVDREIRTVAHVEQIHAATGTAYAGLWKVLTSLDLVARLDAEELAVDETLPWLLTDMRAARQMSRTDFQWSRLLDPAVALSARRYESPGAVTLKVVDPNNWAGGTFRLEADADGAGTCTRTKASPEITLPVDVVSSLWLGGGDLRAAALAGRVDEHAVAAVDRLARLLRTTRAPWTPTWF